MSKSFSHAGVSKQDGAFKVRFCNDALRTKVLQKNGHTHIDIVELKHPMSKLEAVAYLLEIDFDNGNKEVRAALEAALDKRSPAEPKAAKKEQKPTKEAKKPKKDKKVAVEQTPAVQSAVTATPTLSKAELENAPY